MTKLDGDARGGAALSIREVTGKPIKFLGMGEDLEKLEEFRSEGLASRILGMGDVVGLMKDFEDVMDEKQAERDTKKLRGEFTLDDFLSQIKMMQQVGSLSEIYEKFPIFGDQLPEGASIDDSMFKVMESMIQSMTPAERNKPQMIDESRAIRIARGSGRKKEQVLDLVQRFSMMHQLMAGIASQPGLLGNLPGLKQLNQPRKLKGSGKNGLQDLLGGMPGMGGGMPGLPGMPQVVAECQGCQGCCPAAVCRLGCRECQEWVQAECRTLARNRLPQCAHRWAWERLRSNRKVQRVKPRQRRSERHLEKPEKRAASRKRKKASNGRLFISQLRSDRV